MRWIILTAFFSTISLAQTIDTGTGVDGACTEATITTGQTYNCTSLNINSPISVTQGIPNDPLIIKVQGDVTINSAISLNGQSSNYALFTSNSDGGPGAGNGGSYSSVPSDADSPTAGGGSSGFTGSCGGSGGGGSFVTLGANGENCPTGGAGGARGPLTYDPLTQTFRGGYGGGSGADGADGNAGGGGGGGGALHIMAGGTVTINANISAKGGNGGSATGTQSGGPGGGGSGGVIWIQTLGQMTNNGTIDVSGGLGGTSPLAYKGGNGGNGVFKLEDADGVISGTGSGSGASSTSEKLTSSISCGTLSLNDKSTFAQLGFGFFLVSLFQFFGRRLKGFRYPQV